MKETFSQLRQIAGLSLTQIEQLTGYSLRQIQRWETGESTPRKSVVQIIENIIDKITCTDSKTIKNTQTHMHTPHLLTLAHTTKHTKQNTHNKTH